MLISSLREYKKKFLPEVKVENSEIPVDKNELTYSRYVFYASDNEYLSISNDIHSILSKCQDLTSNQKLDFCNNQRYFMKLYLKKLVKKINKA